MKKLFHLNRLLLILLLSVIFAFLPFAFFAQKAAAAPAPAFTIQFILDKPYYQPADKVNATIIITNASTQTPPPLRVFVALKDKTGKLLAYRNRYIGRFAQNQSKVEISFNLNNLKVSEHAYTIEAQLFAHGKQVFSDKTYVFIAVEPKTLVIVPLFNIQMPFRMDSSGVFVDDAPLKYLTEKSSVFKAIEASVQNKMPLMLAISSSTLKQLPVLAKGFKIKHDEGVKEIKSADPQARLAASLLSLLQNAGRQQQNNILLYPYGDLSPEILKQYKLESELIERIAKSKLTAEKQIDGLNFTGYIYLPNQGISKDVVNLLSKNGYAAVVEGGPAVKSGLFDNTVVLFSQAPPGNIEAVDFAASLIEGHLANDQPQTLVVDFTSKDYVFFENTVNELKKYPFIKIQALPPFELVPLSSLEEQKPSYPNFENLIPALIKNYKKAKKMVEAFSQSFVAEESEKKQFSDMLDHAFMAAFNPEYDFDHGFKLFKELQEKLDGLFQQLKIADGEISLASTKAELPVTIINNTGYPVKCILKLKASGVKFKTSKKSVVLSSKENVFTIPIELTRSGKIKVAISLETPAGYQLAANTIIINSNYRTILISLSVLVFILLIAVIYLRLKLKRKKLENI